MTMIYRESPITQEDGLPVATVRIVGSADIAFFKELVQRAVNCWDKAPVSVLEFADLVTVGHIQQDYQRQRSADYRTLKGDAK